MPANLENSAVATGLEKVSFHSNPKEGQCQRIFNVPAKLLQSCPTLSNAVDCSPPGSSVRGILQARRLEWVAISSSRGSSRPGDQSNLGLLRLLHCRGILYRLSEWPGKRDIQGLGQGPDGPGNQAKPPCCFQRAPQPANIAP